MDKDKKYLVPIDLDKIEYAGDTEKEKELNREILETTLELNSYQDAYDKMRDVEEIKEKIKEISKVLLEEETNMNILEKKKANAQIEILTWVLNGSMTMEEKEEQYRVALTEKDHERIQKMLSRMKQKIQDKEDS